jgi:hypothetical protein
MRPSLASLLAIAVATWLPRDLAAQRLPQRELLRPTEFRLNQDDNLFSLPRSQEDIHQWELGLAELEAGEHDAAVERLHKLLTQETGGVVAIGSGRFVGMRFALLRTLAGVSPHAQAAYERLVRREAGQLADRPLHELPAEQLQQLAHRFPTSSLGRRARLRLGDLALERGDATSAASHFLLALDAAEPGSDDERRLATRLAAAQALADVRLARVQQASGTLPPSAVEILAATVPSADPVRHGAIGGGASGATPMAVPAGRPVRVVEEDVTAPGFERRESGNFAMHATGDLEGIYLNTGREVVAYDPLRRSVAWVSEAPLRDAALSAREARAYDDGINHDMVLAAACSDDVVVAPLQVPDRGSSVDFNGGFRILSKIPQRRLFAWSRSTGDKLWSHFDEIDGQRTRRFAGHDACGPPLVVGDTVYAPVIDRSGAIQFAVAAYDLRTGTPRWRRLVCSSQQDVNMFGNARNEFAASPLAAHDGVLYGVSNLGVAYALEMATGRVRWITAYEVVQMPRTMLHGQRDRVVYFANNAPVVADRVVCATPLDSQFVIGLDADTGAPLWQMPAEGEADGEEHLVYWLAGALGDEFVLHGYGCLLVRARPDAASGGEAQRRSLVAAAALRERGENRITPRAAVTQEHVWFARPSGIVGFDRTGTRTALPLEVERFQPGNLVFVDGAVVSLRQRSFDVFYDAGALQSRVEQRLAATPDDPAAILRLASLRSALLPRGASAAAVGEVQALYRRGLAAAQQRGLPVSHPVRQALQRELFSQSLARADAAVLANSRDALALLAAARDAAPDEPTWLDVQARILRAVAADPAAERTELDRLLQVAPDGAIRFGNDAAVPVAGFVAWRRALAATDARQAVAQWQELLERFGELQFDGQVAAALAQRQIASWIERHGAAVYAPIAARATAALDAAGDDQAALRQVSQRFPNSQAAAAARSRLLDRAVAAGDLAMAVGVLAQELRSGSATPALLRRVAVAAEARGNRALAAAMLRRLQGATDTPSDWPADAGAMFGAVAARRLGELQVVPHHARLGLPEREVARIRPRTTREALRLLPITVGAGFATPAEVPLYAIGSGELLAFDLGSRDRTKPVLFRLPVQFLEHVVLCGDLLIVPDLERVVAVEMRSGAIRWELANPQGRLYDSLGVQDGVLHLAGQATDRDGGAELLGVEPTTGAVLFVRSLPNERARPVPKAAAGHLLAITFAGEEARIERLDPIDGRTLATLPLPRQVLGLRADQSLDSLLTRMFVQGLQADAEHVYVPLDSTASSTAARVVALRNVGGVAWTWTGQPGRRLEMVAAGTGRVVVVTSSDEQPGELVVLAAGSGDALQRHELGLDAAVLNWQRSWLDVQLPERLCIGDRAGRRGEERRLWCLSVLGEAGGFQLPVGTDDVAMERAPLFGDDFVTFGVRPEQRGPFRLHSLRLNDRSGALSAGRKSQHLQIGATFGVAQHGTYTVISGSDSLLVLGPADDNR